jgi:hypothetical protein
MPNKPLYNVTGDTSFFISYFRDAALTQYEEPALNTALVIDQYFVTTQPAHFAIGAKIAADPDLEKDADMVFYQESNTAAFLLECSSQFVEMTYTYFEGNAVDIVVSNTSDQAIAAITNPFLIPAQKAWDNMIVGVRQAGLETTMDGLTASFARTYSHTLLSMGVNAMSSAPTLQESTQTMKQITRMPKAPFITLIILNCLYALMGIILAIIALASRPRVVKPVQARLSVTGLVAALFEGERANERATKMSQLFGENYVGAKDSHKISIEPTAQGGWKYRKL